MTTPPPSHPQHAAESAPGHPEAIRLGFAGWFRIVRCTTPLTPWVSPVVDPLPPHADVITWHIRLHEDGPLILEAWRYVRLTDFIRHVMYRGWPMPPQRGH